MGISEKKQIEIMRTYDPLTACFLIRLIPLLVAGESGRLGLLQASDDLLYELDPLSLHFTPESLPHTFRGMITSIQIDTGTNMATDDPINETILMRVFDSGATRNVDDTKPDYEGFLSPLVLARYAQYLTKHRVQADGQVRASDNWQKGIPFDVYMKSAWRHFHDWWTQHRGNKGQDDIEDSICAVMFNAQGYLHERLKVQESKKF